MSDLRTRLRKLLALAKDSDTPESRTARKLYEDLLTRHGLDPADVAEERRARHCMNIRPGTRAILAAICHSLGVEWALVPRAARTKRRKHRWRLEPLITCTDREIEAVRELYAYSATLYLRRRRQMQAELRGYLYGHLHGMYPRQDKDARCPRCNSRLYAYDRVDDRWRCENCGHRGPKAIEVDLDAYNEGVRSAARPMLAQPPLPQLPGDGE